MTVTSIARGDLERLRRRYTLMERLADRFGWLSLGSAGLGWLVLSLDFGPADLWWLVAAAGVLGLLLVGAGIWLAMAGAGVEERLGKA